MYDEVVIAMVFHHLKGIESVLLKRKLKLRVIMLPSAKYKKYLLFFMFLKVNASIIWDGISCIPLLS